MENNIDKIIKNKLQDRKLTVSASAWERLSHQLAHYPKEKKKRKWILYLGYAASIAILISVFFLLNNKDKNQLNSHKEILVETKIDSSKIEQNQFKENRVEEAIVKVDKTVKKQIKIHHKVKSFVANKILNSSQNSVIASNKAIYKTKKKTNIVTRKNDEVILKNNLIIAQNTKTPTKLLTKKPSHSSKSKAKISINPDDLLFEVTHSKTEIKNYYAQYNISRKEVLQNIKKQLKKSNIKINPETILAAVERDVNDEFFRNHFLQNLKSKVSTIVIAIADRNK